MSKKQLKIKDPLDIILNGKPKLKDHPNHIKALAIKTAPSEKFKVKNPITGKTANIVLRRDGTTDERLAMILLAPDATKDQKDSMLASYLFERGRENASFMLELMLYKGTHAKETQAFKRQMRFDFESFANTIVLLFQDMATGIEKGIRIGDAPNDIFFSLMERLKQGAELITKERNTITKAREMERGAGVYLNKHGQAFSITDDEIVEVVKKEREEIKNATSK